MSIFDTQKKNRICYKTDLLSDPPRCYNKLLNKPVNAAKSYSSESGFSSASAGERTNIMNRNRAEIIRGYKWIEAVREVGESLVCLSVALEVAQYFACI